MRPLLFRVFCLGVLLSLPWAPARAQRPEQYRPGYHFTPAAHWMNDPNGMVYYQGTYHLFFQYYPDGVVWGPMHWGHATSPDLLNWKEQPIALYPDSLGYIFSGSAVVDAKNTSGFGRNGQTPLVAIFTHHDPVAEKKGSNTFQNQSLAYSLDAGKTWTKYAGNPVLKNPGIKDFRDPKVSWNEAANKWVMTLATKDRVTFYSSPNLKDWTKESEFGEKLGAHGGVWECPDLFPLMLNGQRQWVLLVSINPGGPNGGSATQYFVGNFDGKTFTPNSTQTKWVDFGKDNYAGVTFANTGDRRIFLGWMSNWQYATTVPTAPWRSAMTVPRELALRQVGADVRLTSQPAPELGKLDGRLITLENLTVKGRTSLTEKLKPGPQYQLQLQTDQLADLAVVLSNAAGEEVVIGYDQKANQYYIDRSKSGQTGFNPDFGGRHLAPRLATGSGANLTLLVDAASVELFADDGLTCMTEIFFARQPLTQLSLRAPGSVRIRRLTYRTIATPGQGTQRLGPK